MEIGYEPIDNLERVSRSDKESRNPLIRFHSSLAPGYPLQGPGGSGTNSYHLFPVLLRLVDLFRRLSLEAVSLSLHPVALHHLFTNRLESPGAHVQS